MSKATLGILAVLLLAFVVVLAATQRNGFVGAAASPALPVLAANIGRDEAIAAVRAADLVGRVDRVDAKLMTVAEYLSGAGAIVTHEGDPAATSSAGFQMGNAEGRNVWVVAVSGEVWPVGRIPVVFGAASPPTATPYPPYRWAMILVDAARGNVLVVADAGVDTEWPRPFASLPSHQRMP